LLNYVFLIFTGKISKPVQITRAMPVAADSRGFRYRECLIERNTSKVRKRYRYSTTGLKFAGHYGSRLQSFTVVLQMLQICVTRKIGRTTSKSSCIRNIDFSTITAFFDKQDCRRTARTPQTCRQIDFSQLEITCLSTLSRKCLFFLTKKPSDFGTASTMRL